MNDNIDQYYKDKKRSFIYGLIAGIVLGGSILTLVCCAVINRNTKYYNDILSEYKRSFSVATYSTDGGELITQDFADKAQMIYEGVLKEFYFEEDIDNDLMRENMYKAIVASLNDKYAEYYTVDELEAMLDESEGIYYGIGSYVMMDAGTGYPVLSGVFKDSPAAKAGLRDGDIIVEVDGENYFGCTLTEWVSKIKGPENTTVELTIFRDEEPDYIHKTITRRSVETPTVESEMMENNIGYIQIKEFDTVTSKQFKDAYDSLNAEGMKGLVLDLRSNGGGNLDTVLEIGSYMLPKGIITYTEDKNGYREEYTCDGLSEIQIPVTVLTNGYTASASELLTGALKDYGKAVSIGTNTYGKGIVQTIYPLMDGSGVKITTSRYYTPLGNCIHEVGIAPDIELELDADLYYSEEKIDNQLERAKEYLMDEMK